MGENKESLNNSGSVCAEYGLFAEAIGYFERCAALDPAYTTGRRNLAKVYVQQGRHNEAILQYEEILKREPLDTDSVRRSADCLLHIGWKKEAADKLRYLCELIPNDAGLRKELGMLYLNELREPVKGRDELMRSLELDPSQPELAETLAQPPNPGADVPTPYELPTPPTPAAPQVPGIESAMPQVPGIEAPGLPQLPGI